MYEDNGDLIFPSTPTNTITSLQYIKTVTAPVLPETKGKVYSFKVSAVNFLGEGKLSEVFQLRAADPPTAPTMVLTK